MKDIFPKLRWPIGRYCHKYNNFYENDNYLWKSVRCEVAKEVDCDISISEFERQSGYYVNLCTNNQRKGTEQLIPVQQDTW